MATVFRSLTMLALSWLAAAAFASDPPPLESDAEILDRATERLSLPPDVPVIEQPAFPTRNFGPAMVEKPQVTVSVTADPFFAGVGPGPYPVAGIYGGYYRPYYAPPVYGYGYHRPWYYGYYARYPYFHRPPYAHPYAPPAPYLYGPPAAYPYTGVYAW
jgi:hypothetical protein